MDEAGLIDELRARVRADLPSGRARPFAEYVEALGPGARDHRAALAAEYARLVRTRRRRSPEPEPEPGWGIGARPAEDALGAGSPPAAPGAGPPGSPPPPARPPNARDSAIRALGPISVPLTEKGEIARGGMGAVLRVRDEVLRRDLAMKVVLDGGDGTPPAASLERFVDEAQIQAQLDHPGVVPVHHLGRSPSGRLCFTMKLVKGRSLEQVLDRVRAGDEPPNLTRAVQCLLRVCETVGFAHEKGVVHRDLKPANVMVGNFGEVYVMDWGLARVMGAPDPQASTQRSVVMTGNTPGPAEPASGDSDGSGGSPRLTQQGSILGTPAYMSPEQARGMNDLVDARSDVYSLGAILYHVLAGHAPYEDSGPQRPADTVRRTIEGPPTPLAEKVRGREELVAVAQKAMARTPADRYPTAREMGDDLQRWIEGRVVRAYRTGAWAELRKWVRRNRLVAASVAFTVIVVAASSARYTMLQHDANEAIQTERDLAVEARDEARVAARRALGLRLAADAMMEAEKDPAKAAALALEAAERAPGAKSVGALYAAIRSVTEVRIGVGHQSYVDHCAWGPDGRRAYSSGTDGLLIAWDPRTAKAAHQVQADPDAVYGFDLSRDGRRIATFGKDAAVRVWDAANLSAVASIDTGAEAVSAVAFSPDGTSVAVADIGAVRVFDAVTGREALRPAGHGGAVGSVAWSPDGSRLASGGADQRVRVWDVATGQETLSVLCADADPAPPSGPASAPKRPPAPLGTPDVAWVLDGKRLLTSSRPTNGTRQAAGARSVRLWDAATGRAVPIVRDGWKAEDVCAVLSGGRTALVAVDQDPGPWQCRFLDFETGATTPAPWAADVYPGQRPLAVRPDGLVLAFQADGYEIHLRSLRGGIDLQRLAGHAYQIGDLAFSPDGRTLMSASSDRTVRFWDAAPVQVRRGVTLRASGGRTPSVYACDSAARLLGVIWTGGGQGRVAELDDAETGDAVWTASGERDKAIIPSPDGRRMAVRSYDAVDVLDVLTRRPIAHFVTPGNRLVVFSPGGDRIAVLSADMAPDAPGMHWFVFDVDAPGPPVRLTNPEPKGEGELRGGAWSADGTLFTCAHGYSGPVVWDARTGEMKCHLLGHTGMVFESAFSPDGRRLVSQAMDSSARVWDLATGEQLFRCAVVMKPGEVAFSGDGKVLAVKQRVALHLFDATDGHLLSRIASGESPFVHGVVVTPDGDFATCDANGTVRLWPRDPEAWVREHVSRRLTQTERAEYGLTDEASSAAPAAPAPGPSAGGDDRR